MNYETQTGPFYKSLMAGLFGGIIVTLANLAYNFVYRGVTRFNPSEIINVTSIIFISLLLSLIAGILYYVIVPYAHKSKLVYMILFAVLTVVVTYVAFTVQRSSNPNVSAQFHGLFAGIVIITGLTDALLIPYMAKHKNPAF
jgi:FtsH-binding integral membrane protein